ncbi:hypothetical protein CEXT_242031 [Caerostris extrusa]|uniref:Uncharacterized protein n=1 Tax=Caerostris extrusa TaxID=172846 RepID=A0AAV4WJF5_CAEEX|nr:hypothetical protein CEXT_242031 [Caerostris extrusa]
MSVIYPTKERVIVKTAFAAGREGMPKFSQANGAGTALPPLMSVLASSFDSEPATLPLEGSIAHSGQCRLHQEPMI